MHWPNFRLLRNRQGFTIIETMLVMVIAGIIVLIVFLVVPTAQRAERNNQRKQTAGLIAAQLDEYANNHGLSFPGSALSSATQATEQCNFIVNELSEILGKPATAINCASAPYDGTKNCVLVSMERYDICFHTWQTSAHNYIGNEDEISIQLGHWCSDNTASPTEYPITAPSGTPHEVKRYVVWVQLEAAPVFCVDNYRN